jgi:hypothetical protein
MGLTVRPAVLLVEVATGHVQNGLDVEISFILPQFGEADSLGMPQEPGRFMVQ